MKTDKSDNYRNVKNPDWMLREIVRLEGLRPVAFGHAREMLLGAIDRAHARLGVLGFVAAPTVGGGFTLIANKHFTPADALD